TRDGSLRTGAGAGSGADSGARFARKRSTIAAISSRLTLVAGVAATTGAGRAANGGCGITVDCAATAGRLLATGRVSNATRLMSIKCNGDTLSEVTLPPQEPQPNVIDGGKAVEKPIAPCVVGVFTVIRDAGISDP